MKRVWLNIRLCWQGTLHVIENVIGHTLVPGQGIHFENSKSTLTPDVPEEV